MGSFPETYNEMIQTPTLRAEPPFIFSLIEEMNCQVSSAKASETNKGDNLSSAKLPNCVNPLKLPQPERLD